MHVPLRPAELLLVVALVAGGTWLRWTHLGTPSLWYDELVHVRTAEKPTAAAVWAAARHGAVPGAGNAGAMPLDYLALHAWTRLAPPPPPDGLERHYRLPAFAFAVAALPLAWGLARSVAGPVAGAVALALLATSLPHVLYAAEARFYALAVLATLAVLAAFAALVRTPTAARTVALTLAGAGAVLTALYGVFPVAAAYLVLAALAVRARAGRRLLVLGASGLVAAGAGAVWIAPSLGTVHPRGAPVLLATGPALAETLRFFAGGSAPLAVVFGLGLATAVFAGPRERTARALAAACLLAMGAVPIMVAVAHWKHYYFHPRHALVLLPAAHLATALVAARLLPGARRAPLAAALGGVLLVAAATAPALRAYVAAPLASFRQTKTHRDFRGLARTLAARTAGQRPDERLVVLVEKRRPGQLANPTLAFYLAAHGAADRVILAGIGDPLPALQRLAGVCPGGCRGPLAVAPFARLGIRDPFNQPPSVRHFLALAHSRPGARVAGVALIAWAPNVPRATPPGFAATPFDGAMLYEPAR